MYILLSLLPNLFAATIHVHKNYDDLLLYGFDFSTYYSSLLFAAYGVKASLGVPFSADTNFRGGITCNLSNPDFNFLFLNRRLTPFGVRSLRRVRFRNLEAN